MSDVTDDTVYETEPALECSITDVSCIGQWFTDTLTSFALWIWEKILNGLVAVFEAIPVPDFILAASKHRIPDAVSFFANVVHLEEGAAMIVTAYTLRFLLRRMPVIG